MDFLKAERVEDFELHNAVSSDDDHSHFLVRGSRVCCLIQHQVHERVVASQDTLEIRRQREKAERVGQSARLALVHNGFSNKRDRPPPLCQKATDKNISHYN